MNKYQWKCKCCGKLKSIKNDPKFSPNIEICKPCINTKTGMTVLADFWMNQWKFERDIRIKTQDSNTKVIEENKAHKQNIFKYMEEIDRLQNHNNRYIWILRLMIALNFSCAFFAIFRIIAKMNGWI